ncbi:hypothetical protein HMPREF9089_00973 [Eubacterium brachy ATCC 33089]|nr:hypothetical protein HMPREF9089_00973 [Eubacterium brachy ATCC 33089]
MFLQQNPPFRFTGKSIDSITSISTDSPFFRKAGLKEMLFPCTHF